MSHKPIKYEAGKGKIVDPYPLTPEEVERFEAAVAQADIDIEAMRAAKAKKPQAKTSSVSKPQEVLHQVEDSPEN
jgi:hypothetical protein